jgi:DNA-directed RNA polymerase specialized sigma24 family protein
LRGLLGPVATPATCAGDSRADKAASLLAPRLARLQDAIDLDDDVRLALKLIYQDGLTVAAAARALRMPEHQVRRMRDRAVSQLRQTMLAAGIGPELLASE